MSYQARITAESDYIHVVVEGSANYANALDLWRRIAQACHHHQCFKVLGEQSMQNPMSTVDAWKHKNIFLEAGITAKFKIAWVDNNPHTFESTDFIRTVLYNRDIGYGKLFNDVAAAKAWLLNDTPA